MTSEPLSILWLIICSGLVFLMQAGFLCLETGLTRSKNSINVALKNIADFAVSALLFWAFGYALMFGSSEGGFLGSNLFSPDGATLGFRSAFFLFQLMFCGTAVTILSGAVAERMRFVAYLLITALVSGLTYPLFGHWAWNGIKDGNLLGWLGALGFVDFAGATVVHSVGGWTALAVLLVIGARSGRFENGRREALPAGNLPLAALGVMLLFVGWFGFNGGSTLAFDGRVPLVLLNTILAACVGFLTGLGLSGWLYGRADVLVTMNGGLAGLVAITASAHAVTSTESLVIGAVGAAVMLAASEGLERLHIDDAVGAVPVHLAAGVWGTLAVGLFADPEVLGTGLTWLEQTGVQFLGILVCAAWTMGVTLLFLWLIRPFCRLRVSAEDERVGLNVSEHGAKTELADLFNVMEQQARSSDLSLRAPEEPFSEAGLIAKRYNALMGRLEHALGHSQAIVARAMDGIMTFSPDLRITLMNPAAERMFGTQQPALLTGLLEPAEEGTLEPALRAALASDKPCEFTGRRADGTSFPLEATLSMATLAGETLWVGTFRDISERKEAEARIRQAKEEAERANEAKSSFLSSVSHELRTPLTSILGFSKIILKRLDEAILPLLPVTERKTERAVKQVRENLAIISSEGERLTSLINDLLDLAKIESGRTDWHMETLHIEEVIERAVAATTALFDAKGLTLVRDLASNLPPITADRDRLIQVVINLISNAVKFTPEGSVVLRARCETGRLVVGVQDSGIGIAPEDHAKVFEKFKQVGDTLTDKPKGTGLGLPISKEIISYHGGDIWLESSLGTGATFLFSLPLGVEKMEARLELPDLLRHLPAPPTETGEKTILVVDDEAAIRLLLRQQFEEQGYRVLEAENGAEGLAFARQYKPDLVILDVMMPKLSGFDVAAALRADPLTMTLPIMILSVVEDKERGYRVGVDRYLTKPIDFDTLSTEVETLLTRGSSSRRVLVLDENLSTLKTLTDALKARGYTVTEAVSGRDLTEQVRHVQPDMILLNSLTPHSRDALSAIRLERDFENVFILLYE